VERKDMRHIGRCAKRQAEFTRYKKGAREKTMVEKFERTLARKKSGCGRLSPVLMFESEVVMVVTETPYKLDQ